MLVFPATEQEWWESKQLQRRRRTEQRLACTTVVVDPAPWLEAVKRDDITDPKERRS